MKKTVWIINQYASTPSSGMGGRHYYLARELAKLGYNVYVVASASSHLLHTQPDFDTPYKLESVEGFTFVWVRMPCYKEAHSKQRALNWFLFSWRLRGLRNTIPDAPDTIMCSSPSPLAFLGAERLAKRYGARLVFEVRDIWPLTLIEIGGYSVKHPFMRFMQWIEDRAYKVSARVVSNLKNSAEHMVARGMNREKFAWIPNGFSRDEVSLKTPLNLIADKGLPKDKFLIGYTGTMGVANALDTVIEAAELLRDLPEVVFVLVGGGREKSSLQASVSQKKLSNVVFIDSIPKVEIQAMLARFDACFIGLTKDPLFRFGVSPNKLFDYLYSGKPIIYAIDSGAYKPVQEEDAGIQIPAEDPVQLAEAVRRLYHLPVEERERMGANGHRAAVSQYEYGQLSEKLAKVLFDE